MATGSARPRTSIIAVATLFLACTTPPPGPQVIDLGSCRPEQLSAPGFKALERAIGDARLVVLGEQVHGVGTDYESFAILVKFLHEELGFNVVAQEYCFFSFGQVADQLRAGGSAQAYRQAMYWPQAKARETDRLLDYVEERRLAGDTIAMEGFDPRIMFRDAFRTFCDSLLGSSVPPLLEAGRRPGYLESLDQVLAREYGDTLTSGPERQAFLQDTDRILERMAQQGHDPRAMQRLRNLRAFAANAWNVVGLGSAHVDRYSVRDRAMAENIFWLAEVMYPGEKLILRMHNGHAARDLGALRGAIPDSLVKEAPNVGTLLAERYGPACLQVATTHHAGTYCGWDYEPRPIPPPAAGSLEADLHAQGLRYAFVPLHAGDTCSMYFNEFNSWLGGGSLRAPFGNLFDGVLFIDQVAMPTEIVEE